MPSLCIWGGVGRRMAPPRVRSRRRSSVTGVLSGAPRSFQSGSNSFRERGSRTEDSRLAVKLIFENLPKAYNNGSDTEAREGMAIGAYYAGLAINQVNVGSVHAIAHQLGGKYGIPHGLANALVLPHVLEFCREEARPRLAELALLVGAGQESDGESALADSFIQAVRDLRTEVGIPEQSDLIKASDFSYLADLAVAEGVSYPVPRLMSHGDVYAILSKISA